MKAILRAVFCAVLVAGFYAGEARAERIVRINDNTGFFSQPSVVLDGSVAHVAYVRADNTAGPFTVFYAAVNAGADFTNITLTQADFRAQVVVTPQTPVADTVGSADNTYVDARHPRIALRSTGKPVIFFQARPPGSVDNSFVLFRALLTVQNNVVTSQAVTRVGGAITAGDVETPAYGLVPADNTARLVYANKSSITALAEPFQVFYARIGLDNAQVVGSPLPLSSPFLAGGTLPTPDLRLDGLNRSHVAWSSDIGTSGAGIHYAMIKDVNAVDNAVIPATLVMSRLGSRWAHPAVLPLASGLVLLTAADHAVPGVSGDVGFVEVNPANAKQDGNPVDTGIGANNTFLQVPPGQGIVPGVKLASPAAAVDSSDRIHMTGLGGFGAFSQYVAFHPTAASPFSEILTAPTAIGLDNNAFPAVFPGDFTVAAFLHLSGRALVVWSGIDNVDAQASNLNVSTVPGLTDPPQPAKESGCSVATGHRRGDRETISGALTLLLPPVFLWIRRRLRRGGLAK